MDSQMDVQEITSLLSVLESVPDDPMPVFKLLEERTGITPYRETSRGKFKPMIRDWLEWGEKQGLYVPSVDPPQDADPPEVSDAVNPLVDVLNNLMEGNRQIEARMDRMNEAFSRLVGVMNLLVDHLGDARKPWHERRPPSVGEEDSVPPPSSVETPPPLPPPPRDPPVSRNGRIYH